MFRKFHRKTSVQGSLFNKVEGLQQFFEIPKNTFYVEHFREIASKVGLVKKRKRDSQRVFLYMRYKCC